MEDDNDVAMGDDEPAVFGPAPAGPAVLAQHGLFDDLAEIVGSFLRSDFVDNARLLNEGPHLRRLRGADMARLRSLESMDRERPRVKNPNLRGWLQENRVLAAELVDQGVPRRFFPGAWSFVARVLPQQDTHEAFSALPWEQFLETTNTAIRLWELFPPPYTLSNPPSAVIQYRKYIERLFRNRLDVLLDYLFKNWLPHCMIPSMHTSALFCARVDNILRIPPPYPAPENAPTLLDEQLAAVEQTFEDTIRAKQGRSAWRKILTDETGTFTALLSLGTWADEFRTLPKALDYAESRLASFRPSTIDDVLPSMRYASKLLAETAQHATRLRSAGIAASNRRDAGDGLRWDRNKTVDEQLVAAEASVAFYTAELEQLAHQAVETVDRLRKASLIVQDRKAAVARSLQRPASSSASGAPVERAVVERSLRRPASSRPASSRPASSSASGTPVERAAKRTKRE